MKIVLAIEGMDGAGKSTLALYIERLCQEHGHKCHRIGRRTGYVSPVVAKITQVLGEEAGRLHPPAETFVRMGRECQRAYLAAEAPPGVVVLDRFVLTILALARVSGQQVGLLTRQLLEIVSQANLMATIFVDCPLEVAWQRVKHRSHGLSSTLTRGEIMMHKITACMEEDFERGILTGLKWRVDNSGTMEAAEQQVAAYLLPYLGQVQRKTEEE